MNATVLAITTAVMQGLYFSLHPGEWCRALPGLVDSRRLIVMSVVVTHFPLYRS